MVCHIVAIPKTKDLEIIDNLRSYIYQNNFRFKNKPLSSDTHITLAEIDIKASEIQELKNALLAISIEMPFHITNKEWILTKENKEPNYKYANPYTWIALKFPQRKKLYQQVDDLTKRLGVNNNEKYISDVKKIEKTESEYIGNHINLSNYTRRERSEECWQYFNKNLPMDIAFDTLALRNLDGSHLFEIKY